MSIVFIISAPSGSGKSTLVHRLLKTVDNLTFSISYTTRLPRGQERDGESYHFISREEFEGCIARGEFLEHADVFGNYYGTHRRVLDGARERELQCLEQARVVLLGPQVADRADDDRALGNAQASAQIPVPVGDGEARP